MLQEEIQKTSRLAVLFEFLNTIIPGHFLRACNSTIRHQITCDSFRTPFLQKSTCCYCRVCLGGVVCDAGRWSRFQVLAFSKDSFCPTGVEGIAEGCFSSQWLSLARKEYPTSGCRPRVFSRRFSRHFPYWTTRSFPRCGRVGLSETRLSTCFDAEAVMVEHGLFPVPRTSQSPATLMLPPSPLRCCILTDRCCQCALGWWRLLLRRSTQSILSRTNLNTAETFGRLTT